MLEYCKDYIVKQLNIRSMCIRNSQPITEWYNFYQKFQKQEECLVKIFDFNEDDLTFKMPIIKGLQLSNFEEISKLSIKQRRTIASQIITLYGRMQTFTVYNHDIFFHKDFNLSNLIYNVRKQKLTLIDPDSFQVLIPKNINSVYHGSFVDTLYNIKQWEML